MAMDPQGDDEDEFPSEKTRIDPGLQASLAEMRANNANNASATSRPAPQAASGSIERKPPPRASKSSDSQPNKVGPENIMSAKLAALQSLSHDAPVSDTAPISTRPGQASGGSSKLPWILLVLVLAGVGGNWYWTKKYNIPGGASQGGATGSALKIEVVTSTGGSGAAPLVAAGFTAARDPIAIGVPAGGVIKDVRVVNGDKVKAGQPVVLLDDSSAQADRSLAYAEIHDAERNLAQINALARAQAATVVDVGRARGAVEIARAKLRPIEQRIRQMRINAPADVTVLEVLVHPGETVGNNTPVVKVADLAKLVAEVDINEADVVKIRRGQSVDVSSDTFTDKVFKGTVREIAENVDKTRGTVQVKVDLQVPDQSLRPGMSVKSSFLPDQAAKPRIFVSRTAVSTKGTVFLVGSDRKMKERAVVTQSGTGSSVEVMSGLVNGDRIIGDANQGHDGQLLPSDP